MREGDVNILPSNHERKEALLNYIRDESADLIEVVKFCNMTMTELYEYFEHDPKFRERVEMEVQRAEIVHLKHMLQERTKKGEGRDRIAAAKELSAIYMKLLPEDANKSKEEPSKVLQIEWVKPNANEDF